jgi:hypothetical protein
MSILLKNQELENNKPRENVSQRQDLAAAMDRPAAYFFKPRLPASQSPH